MTKPVYSARKFLAEGDNQFSISGYPPAFTELSPSVFWGRFWIRRACEGY